ncbi:MAG: low molecular weight protein-tyrosine-phosphatase [Acidobacteriota bacterium]
MTIRVLFVCTANICRSPMAEGIFRHLVAEAKLSDQIETDSAAISPVRVGEPPDPRAQQIVLKRGIDIGDLRSREVWRDDFHRFDYLVAMDRTNYTYLRSLCPRGCEHKLFLMMEFAPAIGIAEVPDPYAGGEEGFELVYRALDIAARNLLTHIRQQHQLALEEE